MLHNGVSRGIDISGQTEIVGAKPESKMMIMGLTKGYNYPARTDKKPALDLTGWYDTIIVDRETFLANVELIVEMAKAKPEEAQKMG
mgnify:CR=1 FL=1